MAEFRKASFEDALTIVKTRQKAWNATYRGIYPDEAIDAFDYKWHLEAEQRRLKKPDFHCYMVLEQDNCVGYFSYGPTVQGFRLHSLYLLPLSQRNGLGRRIFEQVKSACLSAGFHNMYLDCHPDNRNALGFYRHMGGVITAMDTGHENPMEDSCRIEYHFT